jgi:hypothetical protein
MPLFLLFFLSFSLFFATRPGEGPSRLPLHLPLPSLTPQPKPLSCSPWTQGMGGAREDLGGDPLPFFFPPSLPSSTPNRRSAPPLQHHPDPSTQRDPAPTSPCPLPLAGVTREHDRCQRLQEEVIGHHCATQPHSPPPSSTNRALPPRAPIGHAMALSCMRSAPPWHVETGTRVPAHTCTLSRRSAHGRARHRAPDTMRNTPGTIASLARHAMHRNAHTRTETDAAAKQTLHARPSQP